MPNYIKLLGSAIGFGLTPEEAEMDAYTNSCMISLNNDAKHTFKQRRAELKPWMPTPLMLHLSGVGCLSYESGMLTETGTGRSAAVTATGTSMFYYLSKLLGQRLSYTDIVCAVRAELDILFQNISNDFTLLQNMDIIQCQQETISFIPTAVYNTAAGFVIGCSEGAIGIKFQGEDSYYIAQTETSDEQVFALYRLMYRTGTSLKKVYAEEQHD